MRDPARIDRIVELLRWYWHLNPDLRLGQIVVNLTPERFKHEGLVVAGTDIEVAHADPYHVEDTEWEQVLDAELVNL